MVGVTVSDWLAVRHDFARLGSIPNWLVVECGSARLGSAPKA